MTTATAFFFLSCIAFCCRIGTSIYFYTPSASAHRRVHIARAMHASFNKAQQHQHQHQQQHQQPLINQRQHSQQSCWMGSWQPKNRAIYLDAYNGRRFVNTRRSFCPEARRRTGGPGSSRKWWGAWACVPAPDLEQNNPASPTALAGDQPAACGTPRDRCPLKLKNKALLLYPCMKIV